MGVGFDGRGREGGKGGWGWGGPLEGRGILFSFGEDDVEIDKIMHEYST